MPNRMCLSPNGQVESSGPGPADQILVATINGMVTLRRTSIGSEWRVSGHSLVGHHLGALAQTITQSLIAGAHGAGGLWLSMTGNGSDWQTIDPGLQHRHIYAIATMGNGTLLVGTDPASLSISDDLGQNWRDANITSVPDVDKWTFPVPPHQAHVKSITIHPTDPQRVYVLVEQGALLHSADGGQSFTEISSYATSDDAAYRDLHRLLIYRDLPLRMFLATGEGLYRTDDTGENWDHLTGPDGRIGYPDHLFFDPLAPETLYMAGTDTDPGHWFRGGKTRPGLLRSNDNGNSWVEIDLPLDEPALVAIEAMSQHVWRDETGKATGHTLALATAAGHVLTTDDGGVSWSNLDSRIAPVSKDGHYQAFLPR